MLPIDSVKDRTNLWHTDVTFMSKPPTGSFLYTVTLPESGGDTMWANTRAASDALAAAFLRMLYDHMTQYQFIARYRWQPGSLAFWDNRTTMHYGIYDYGDDHRAMHRVTLEGDRTSAQPVAANADADRGRIPA